MKYVLLLLLALVTGCAGERRQAAEPFNPRDTILRLVFGADMGCSGTAIGPDTILTAWHCVEKAPLNEVNGQTVRMVSKVKTGPDAAVVTIEGVRFGKWAKRGPLPNEGERVRYWGNPSGAGMVVYREGYVAAVDPEGRGIAFDLTICHGDSGAGVFNNSGEIVAVVSYMTDASGCTFMVGVLP